MLYCHLRLPVAPLVLRFELTELYWICLSVSTHIYLLSKASCFVAHCKLSVHYTCSYTMPHSCHFLDSKKPRYTVCILNFLEFFYKKTTAAIGKFQYIHCAAACVMFCIVETVPVGRSVVVMLVVLCAAECGWRYHGRDQWAAVALGHHRHCCHCSHLYVHHLLLCSSIKGTRCHSDSSQHCKLFSATPTLSPCCSQFRQSRVIKLWKEVKTCWIWNRCLKSRILGGIIFIDIIF